MELSGESMTDKPLGVKIFLTVFIFVFAYVPAATAGTLTIKTETTVKTENNRLHVTVKVENTGNVGAHNVQANLVVLGERLKSPVKTELGVNQSDAFDFEKVVSGIKKGRYPLTVMVDFHDANQYPFSALSGTTFYFKEDVNADLLCLTDDMTMDENGELRFVIKNLGFGPKNILATLALPKELSTPRPQVNFQIESRGEKTLIFEIVNFSALSGATYPVFCYLEYDLGDTHYTAVSRAVVKIAKSENWFRRTRWVWIGVAVLVGAAFVLYQFKRRIAHSAEGKAHGA